MVSPFQFLDQAQWKNKMTAPQQTDSNLECEVKDFRESKRNNMWPAAYCGRLPGGHLTHISLCITIWTVPTQPGQSSVFSPSDNPLRVASRPADTVSTTQVHSALRANTAYSVCLLIEAFVTSVYWAVCCNCPFPFPLRSKCGNRPWPKLAIFTHSWM